MRKFLALGDPVVPPHVAAELVRLLEERGFEPSVALLDTGIEPALLAGPRSRLSYRQLRALLASALRLTGDSTLGLALGRRLVMGRLGSLGYALLNAKDLAHALSLIERYSTLLVPHVEAEVVRDGGLAVLRMSHSIRLGSLGHFVSEAIAGAVLAQLGLVVDGPLPVREVRFDYAEPPHAEAYYALGCPVSFEAEALEIVFDADALRVPLRFASEVAFGVAEHQCEAEVDDRHARKSVVAQVRQLLRDREEGFPDVRSAARRLQTSERSLRRALHESGTSFQSLVDEMRRELAMEYLKSTQVSVQDIARIAGFSDGRSFRRAFKRWTGMTPAEARRSNTAEPYLTLAEPRYGT